MHVALSAEGLSIRLLVVIGSIHPPVLFSSHFAAVV